jgi:hypothetical protein
MPFVLHSTQGALAYLRSYGFRTFGTVWDETYDDIADDQERTRAIADLVTRLDQQTTAQKQALYEQALPIVQHNYEHFYSGGFRQRLWQELQDMLEQLDTYRPAILDEQDQL